MQQIDAVLGHACSLLWPEVQPALSAIVGAGAVLAATIQGFLSAVVRITELDRPLIGVFYPVGLPRHLSLKKFVRALDSKESQTFEVRFAQKEPASAWGMLRPVILRTPWGDGVRQYTGKVRR